MQLDTAYIRARRLELGLSQSQAAKAAGWAWKTSGQRWSEIERGHRSGCSLGSLTTIARVLQCPLETLLKTDRL